jgi:hypothetical protein
VTHFRHFWKPSPLQGAGRVPPLLPSPAGLFIYSSRGACPPTLVELSTQPPLLQAFPSPGTMGEMALTAFSSPRVYLQFTWEVPLPHCPAELSSHGHFYKLSRSKVAVRGPPLLPCPAGLFIYSSRREGPSPPSALRVPRPLCYVSFLLFIQFFFFFPWVGISLSRGLC